MLKESVLQDIATDEVSAISIPYPFTQSMAKELIELREISKSMESALDRLKYSYENLLAKKSVRDVTETLAEAEYALALYYSKYPKEN